MKTRLLLVFEPRAPMTQFAAVIDAVAKLHPELTWADAFHQRPDGRIELHMPDKARTLLDDVADLEAAADDQDDE